MRRVSVRKAHSGMVLARAIHDGKGFLIMDEGTVLDARRLPALSQLEVDEILVQDERVDDIIVVPVVSEDVEARAIRLLHRLIDDNRGKAIGNVQLDLIAVDRVAKDMVQGFYSVFMGEIDVAGSTSLANYDYIHPVKSTALSLLIAKEAGFSRADLGSLGMASLLQNVGYLSVPWEILSQLDTSVEETSEQFRKHPEHGCQIVRQSWDVDLRISEAVMQHHERWDGSGYPRGLKGKEICSFARIMAIASTYHALVSRRPHQGPYSPADAAEYIAAYSGELFDPDLAQIFYRSVPFYPRGKMVKLSDGSIGIVADANVSYIGRPLVRVCYDWNNQKVAIPYDMDLSRPEHQNKMIVETLDA